MAELQLAHLDAVPTSGRDLRHGWDGLQEGVWAAGDMKVTAGVTGLSVDVAAGIAYVLGDAVTDQGLYRCRNDGALNSAAFDLGGIPAAHATLPRLDQIIARAYDTTEDQVGLREWRYEVIPGTADAGATLDTRTGAGALPDSAVRLADVLVPAGATSIVAANIRDRRPWARGAFQRKFGDNSANFTTTSATMADLAPTQLNMRLECSGKPIEAIFNASAISHSAANGRGDLQIAMDGAALANPINAVGVMRSTAGNFDSGTILHGYIVPTPGSHLFSVQWARSTSGTMTMWNSFGFVPNFMLREVLRDLADNG